MSLSSRIRELAQSGQSVSEIARLLGIRYQHAYKVCRDSDLILSKSISSAEPPFLKPALTASQLGNGGFIKAGCWKLVGDSCVYDCKLPSKSGVYAFCIEDHAVYIGLASKSLSKRIYFYSRPSQSQRTNLRLNALILDNLTRGVEVEIWYAHPPSSTWNGFSIRGDEGLEAGLIQQFSLPWNMRGAL